MPTPDFVLKLREKIGHDQLWLSGITAVVTRGDEMLIVRRADNGAWTPVNGIIDPGEEPAVAAEREVLEETGVVAVCERLAWVHTLSPTTYVNGDQTQYLDLTFRCRYFSGEPYPADGEATEARWCALDRLPEMAENQLQRIRYALSDDRATRFER